MREDVSSAEYCITIHHIKFYFHKSTFQNFFLDLFTLLVLHQFLKFKFFVACRFFFLMFLCVTVKVAFFFFFGIEFLLSA